MENFQIHHHFVNQVLGQLRWVGTDVKNYCLDARQSHQEGWPAQPVSSNRRRQIATMALKLREMYAIPTLAQDA